MIPGGHLKGVLIWIYSSSFAPPLQLIGGGGKQFFLRFAYILHHTIFVSVHALGPSVDLNTKMKFDGGQGIVTQDPSHAPLIIVLFY